MCRGVTCRTAFVLLLLALGSAFSVPSAGADTAGIIAPQNEPHTPGDGWQAGTCTTDTPTCTVDTPENFFKDAAGHPQRGFTQFIVKHEPPGETPVDEVKTIRVDLPAGLSVNPQATPQCPLADFENDPESCPAGSAVGESAVTASLLGVPTAPIAGATRVPVYNIVPPHGEPARFGLHLLGNDIYLEADVAWEDDYHEGFTIHVPETPFAELPLLESGVVLKNRLVFDGRSGDGTFITTPSTCFDPEQPPHESVYSTYLLASSISEEESPGYVFPQSARPAFESPLPEGEKPIDCEGVPYDPSIDVDPDTSRTDSPAGIEADVEVPHIVGGSSRESSQTKRAEVTLPRGMGLNPSAANGLRTCSDSEFGKGTRRPVDCPSASKIGEAEIDTPPLPDGSLEGEVYVGEQLSRDPESGEQYRIFIHVESERYGISARLVGKVRADARTGQLSTTFDDEDLGGLPQVPFSSFRLDFDDGPTAVLTSPPTCDSHRARTEMTPWSGNAPAQRSDSFTLRTIPTGGECPEELEDRPFALGFGAGTDVPRAGAFSPLNMVVARADGNQELKGVDITLPPGLTGKLAGLTYCPEAAIAAAAGKSGESETAAPSCPATSYLGAAAVTAGSGPSPVHILGKVFLAGPYNGAPLSLAVVTPATAGPFDLGTVVVRVALLVDPRTARVRALSDSIPHVFGGATLDIRSVAVRLDRPGFSLNPTRCGSLAIGGTLVGGGGDPLDPAEFSSLPVASPFFVVGCKRLGFRPKLFLRLFGAKRRAKNPKFRAVLQARRGDANTGRAAVILPRALILDQANLQKVCTRVQFAARACPRNSIYGWARAFSPLLDQPLQGPVYLRSSDNPLPDLVASLRGQVDIELAGRTDSVRGRIRNIFDVVPDVPVNKFILTLRGGRKGLLVNSRNLCPRGKRARKPLRAAMRFRAHNGKKLNRRINLRKPCGRGARKR